MTHVINGNQHSQHPKKLKKQPENRKEVSELDGSKQREIELINKKV